MLQDEHIDFNSDTEHHESEPDQSDESSDGNKSQQQGNQELEDEAASSNQDKGTRSARRNLKDRQYKKGVVDHGSEEELAAQLAEILLQSRFMFLRHFHNRFADGLIRAVFEKDISETSHLYDCVYRRILGYCKNWKHLSVKAAMVCLQISRLRNDSS